MHEFRADDPFELGNEPLLDALVEESEVFFSRSFNKAAKVNLNSASASAALSEGRRR